MPWCILIFFVFSCFLLGLVFTCSLDFYTILTSLYRVLYCLAFVQNSSIHIEVIDPHGMKTVYYMYIEDIWELNYGERLKTLSLVETPKQCECGQLRTYAYWLKNVGEKDDPWVFTDCVAHVFYVLDPATRGDHVVISRKQKMLELKTYDDEDYI